MSEGILKNLGNYFIDPIKEAAKFASNPVNLRRVDVYGNSVLGNIAGGMGGLASNPYIGGAVSSVIPTIQESINKYGEFRQSDLGKIVAPAISAATAITNPAFSLANTFAGNIKPPTKEQKANQENSQKALKNDYENSKKLQKYKEDLKKKGDIVNWDDFLIRNTINLPAFGAGLVNPILSALDTPGEMINHAVKGDYLNPLEAFNKVYKNRESSIQEFERNANNSVYIGLGKRDTMGKEGSGRARLKSKPLELIQRMDELNPKAIDDILMDRTDSQHDYLELETQALRSLETDFIRDMLNYKVSTGSKTIQEAEQEYSDHEKGQQAREAASWILDPLIFYDVAKTGLNIGGKALGIGSKLQKVQKGAKEIKDVSKLINEYGQIPTKVDNSIPQAPKTIEKLADVSKPMEEVKVLEKAKSNVVKPEKVSQAKIQEETDLIKNTVNGIDNKQAAEIVLQRTSDKITQQADEVANKLWKKIAGLSEDVPAQPELTSVYTPPKVSIGLDGKMIHDPTAVLPPVQITFRNGMHKLFYEMSMPYNKAIFEGFGMDWKTHSKIAKNITKSVVEPLAEVMAGNKAPEFINRIKSALGQAGSEIAKFAAKNPGKPIIFSELKASKTIDGLLQRLSRNESVQRSLQDGISSIEQVSREERRINAAERLANIKNNKQVKAFTELGLPEDLAERTAPFYQATVMDKKLINNKGLNIPGNKPGTSIGKVLSESLTDTDDLINVSLHEDTHKMFEYLYAQTGNAKAALQYVKNTLIKDLPDASIKYLKKVLTNIKSLGTEESNYLTELVAYHVQTKDMYRRMGGVRNQVTNALDTIRLKAVNGDDAAAMLLDRLDEVSKFIKRYADTYEQNLVNELQALKFEDGSTAWDRVNKLDPTKVHGNFPGEKYGKITSLGEHAAYLEDSTKRMNRLQEIMGSQEVVYRGTLKPLSTGKPRTNPLSNDAMYGPGTYTSTNPQQAFAYTGNGMLTDNPNKKLVNPKGDMRAYYQGLERPLFWDEQVPLDLYKTVAESKNPTIKKAIEFIGGEEEIALMSMEDFSESMPQAIQHALNPKLKNALRTEDFEASQRKYGKQVFDILMDEIYKKSGYDGFVGPNTDEALGYTKGGGFEIVPFEGHNLLERTSEMRKADLAAKKIPSKTRKYTLTPKKLEDEYGSIDLEDITNQINNIQNRTASGINYHINRE